MKIVGDREVCVGAGMCVVTAAAVFDQGDDGIVTLLVEEVATEQIDAVRDAVSLCPSGALKIVED